MPDQHSYIDFKQYVDQLLGRLGWTQKGLAAKIDIGEHAVTRAKKGQSSGTKQLDFVERLQRTLEKHLEHGERDWLNEYHAWLQNCLDDPATESWEDRWRRRHEAQTAVRERYLASLRERLGFVTTHAFVDPTSNTPRRLALIGPKGVYEPLSFDLAPDRMQTEDKKQAQPGPFSLTDLLNRGGHLAVIGRAGSGKTTVLSLVGTCLASTSPAELIPGLQIPDPTPLPVYLPLRDFDLACSGGGDRPTRFERKVPDLLRYLDDWFNAGRDDPLPNGFLAGAVRDGKAWLFLDAMDEVPDPVNRETIRNRILELAGSDACASGTRLIVTARVAAYRNAPLDDRFQVAQVRELSPEQQRGIVRRLYAGLALENHARRADQLIRRIQAPDFPQQLLQTPVELWTTAIVDVFEGTLPKGRAALYERYVDIMLKKKYELQRGDARAVDAWANQDWTVEERWQVLTFAAFGAHRWLETKPPESDVIDSLDSAITLDLLISEEMLTGYLNKHLYVRPEEAKNKAKAFVALMAEQSGLLIEDARGYHFGTHQTMQEFLAGCYLGGRFLSEDPGEYEAFVAEAYCKTWWQEVFKLAAGYLYTQKDFSSRIPLFLRKIGEQGKTTDEKLQARSLAASALHELSAMIRPPEKPAPQWYDRVWEEMTSKLRESLNSSSPEAEVNTRQQAGLLLGDMYGWPDKETLRSRDPRFPGLCALPEFDPVPEGWFLRGDESSEYPGERLARQIYVDGFAVARYPVTNAMYSLFVKDGGYEVADYWQAAIRDDRWADGKITDWISSRNHPGYWDDARLNNPAQPVVGVTWYEADAYCAWLRARTGQPYRLPTEAEWEKTARHDPESDEDRAYPWGQTWEDGLCNTTEAGLGQLNAVGVFPDGASACGAQDMSGNVWEWCSDVYDAGWYARSSDLNPQLPFLGEGAPVLRGGSWHRSQRHARCAVRDASDPDLMDYGLGLRLVVSLSASGS